MRKGKRVLKLLMASSLSVFITQHVSAGGFSLYTEGSAVAVGNFAAGVAAEAQDASIGWYNPAGLSLLDKEQMVFSGVGVFPSSRLNGTSTFGLAPGSPFLLPPYVEHFTGLQGAKDAFVPAFHFAKPLGRDVTFGFSVVSPFGLSTDYDKKSPVRYAATHTELITINAAPELGAKITKNVAIGAGADFQWARVKFNRMLGAPILAPIIPGASPTSFDSLSYNKGDSFALGFHAGLMLLLNQEHTRLGVNYQSQMHHKFKGYSRLSGPLADPNVSLAFQTGNVNLLNPGATSRSNDLSSGPIDLPDITALSFYHDINEKLALLGSAIYTRWSSFEEITLNQVAAGSPATGPFLTNRSIRQNYKNVWRIVAGANIRVSNDVLFRFGAGQDQTPTNNKYREVRLPDTTRWAMAMGVHYQVLPCLNVDVGYTYLWGSQESRVSRTEELSATSNYNVTAKGNVHAHLLGLQAVWLLDKQDK